MRTRAAPVLALFATSSKTVLVSRRADCHFLRAARTMFPAATFTRKAAPLLVHSLAYFIFRILRRPHILLKLPADLQQREARLWLESAGRTFTLELLLESAAHPPLCEACLAAYQRLAVRPTGVIPCAKAIRRNL